MSVNNGKVCRTCKEFKEFDKFYKASKRGDGYQYTCKACQKEYAAEYYQEHKEEIDQASREWAKANPDKMVGYFRTYHEVHKEKLSEQRKNRTPEQIAEAILRSTVWAKNNPEAVKKTHKKWVKKELATNITFRLKMNLRSRLRDALHNLRKAGSAVRDLGCTGQQLKEHLESLWTKGMSWDNYGHGRDKWTIDHIQPLVSFDLGDRVQFLAANHFTNLQPLWFIDNVRKGGRCNGV